MFRKGLLLLSALVFAVGAHLRPCWDYTIPGERVLPGFSLSTASLAERAARDAAEEILPGPAGTPACSRRLRLRLTRSSSDVRMLSDALLRSTQGVKLRGEVRVDGERLGWVADEALLRETLARYIGNTLPTWADGGVLSRELTIRSLYTRERPVTSARDMVLLITGAAPVFYYDASGRYARA